MDTPIATSRKLWLGFGILTLLLIVAVLAVALRLESVETQIVEMANARARAAAARELEVSILDFALDVRQHLDAGGQETRAAIAADAAEVEQSRTEYKRLATTDRQREMASRVDAMWGELRGLGEALIDGGSRAGGQDLERFRNLRLGLERVIDEEVQRDAEGDYDARRASTLRDVQGVETFALLTLVVGALIGVITGVAVSRRVVRAERSVRESRELLRVTLASIGDGVMTTDVMGQVTYVNAVAEHFTGWTNDAARGLPVIQVFRIINDKTRQAVENPVMRALREGVIVGHANHTVLISKDGTERPIDDSAAPIRNENGTIIGCVLTFRDITERKQAERAVTESERRLRFVLDSMPQKIFTATSTGDVDYFNPQWTEFTGLTFEQLREWGWTQLVHPDDVAENLRSWQASVSSGEPFEFEHRFRSADGRYRWHISRAVPVRDDAGRVFMWVDSSTDINEQRETANALRHLTADLSEADRHKNEFLAMLAHELRNPLAPIRNAVEILRRSSANHDALNVATEMMQRQVGQMVRLIEDLLDVSRISRGTIELRRGAVDLASVVHPAIEATQPLFEHHGLEWTVTLPPEPVYVHADAARLTQVIGNLLSNAAKFTGKGGHVALTVETEGGHAVVRVRDTGIGVAPDQLERVFDLFMQVDTSLERPQGGLGIGLTLAKTLVEQHDGTITVHSPGLGLGTEFVIRLPVLVEVPESLSALLPSGHHKPEAPPRRVLVVDDNLDSAESMAMLMELYGHQVRMAHDGLQAVEVAAAFLPEVVLLDIGLPHLNGYEVARRIRQMPSGKRVLLIALTGWGQEADRLRSAESGFDVHLVKPVDHDVLAQLMADLPSTSEVP